MAAKLPDAGRSLRGAGRIPHDRLNVNQTLGVLVNRGRKVLQEATAPRKIWFCVSQPPKER